MTVSAQEKSISRISQDFRNTSKFHEGKHRKNLKKPSPVTLRLTEEERNKLKYLSQGMSISAYIRKCVFGNNTVKRKRTVCSPIKDQEDMAKALGLLGQSRIANNLNQLAYHANTGSLPMNEETYNQIKEAYGHVRSMRNALIKALGLIEKPSQ